MADGAWAALEERINELHRLGHQRVYVEEEIPGGWVLRYGGPASSAIGAGYRGS